MSTSHNLSSRGWYRMRSLKLISHLTINQLHYQIHKPFVRVLFFNITLCLEGSRFENMKKNLTKKERQVIVGLKFRNPNAPPPPNSLTPCLWNLLIVHRRFKQSIVDITNVGPLDDLVVLLIVHPQRHQHHTSWGSIVAFDSLSPMSPTPEPPKFCR